MHACNSHPFPSSSVFFSIPPLPHLKIQLMNDPAKLKLCKKGQQTYTVRTQKRIMTFFLASAEGACAQVIQCIYRSIITTVYAIFWGKCGANQRSHFNRQRSDISYLFPLASCSHHDILQSKHVCCNAHIHIIHSMRIGLSHPNRQMFRDEIKSYYGQVWKKKGFQPAAVFVWIVRIHRTGAKTQSLSEVTIP